MTFTKSLLCGISALTLATGAAFAGGSMSSNEASGPELLGGPEQQESIALDSLESGDREFFAQSQGAQSEGAMTDAITSAQTGQMMEYDVYYIVPVEVVEVEEVWLIPSGEPHG